MLLIQKKQCLFFFNLKSKAVCWALSTYSLDYWPGASFLHFWQRPRGSFAKMNAPHQKSQNKILWVTVIRIQEAGCWCYFREKTIDVGYMKGFSFPLVCCGSGYDPLNNSHVWSLARLEKNPRELMQIWFSGFVRFDI